MEHIKKVMKVLSKPGFMEQAGRSTIENCLCVALLGLAMVNIPTSNFNPVLYEEGYGLIITLAITLKIGINLQNI